MALPQDVTSVTTSDGVRLHVLRAGPGDGPLVVLLHGFPEFSYGWRHQVGPLADAGFRVLAPDQRGYNLSDKPKEVASYRLDRLARDVLELIDAEGRDTAALVGHDWGGAVAWHAAAMFPGRVERLAVLNCPHPAAFGETLARSPAQWLRSAYIAFFQLPRLPEALLGGRKLERALRGTSRPGTFTDDDLGRYRAAWSRRGALTGMLNWYRAGFRHGRALATTPRVRVHALLLWGAKDRFLGRETAERSMAHCDNGRLVFLEGATHWVQHEEADAVNARLVAFLRGGAS
jgi:pimeloyl-ACP methyl ester carboxylesterase